MKEILVPHGKARKEMEEIFGVSHVTVRNALKGRTKNELAMRIRTLAVKRYGGSEVGSRKPIK